MRTHSPHEIARSVKFPVHAIVEEEMEHYNIVVFDHYSDYVVMCMYKDMVIIRSCVLIILQLNRSCKHTQSCVLWVDPYASCCIESNCNANNYTLGRLYETTFVMSNYKHVEKCNFSTNLVTFNFAWLLMWTAFTK